MGFLAPLLGGLGGAGLSAITGNKTNQQNLQQQQQAIQNARQAWQQAIGQYQNYMTANPGPFSGGVAQPGGLGASPFNPHPINAGQIMSGGPATSRSQPFIPRGGGMRNNPVGGFSGGAPGGPGVENYGGYYKPNFGGAGAPRAALPGGGGFAGGSAPGPVSGAPATGPNPMQPGPVNGMPATGANPMQQMSPQMMAMIQQIMSRLGAGGGPPSPGYGNAL